MKQAQHIIEINLLDGETAEVHGTVVELRLNTRQMHPDLHKIIRESFEPQFVDMVYSSIMDVDTVQALFLRTRR